MTTTTKRPVAATTRRFTTDRANGPQHIPAHSKEQDMPIIPQNPEDDQQPSAVGQYAYCRHRSWPVRRTGIVVAYVPPAAASGHDYPAWIVEYPPSVDDHPAVQALAVYNGMHRGLFRAEELEPVSSDDAPPATNADVVMHLTGVLPDVERALAADVAEYRCDVAGCEFVIGAVGPVDPDEPDLFAEEVAAHRRWHELPAVDDEVHPAGASHDVDRAAVVVSRAAALLRDGASRHADLTDHAGTLDELPCPVSWCERDHDTDGWRVDGISAFNRFHQVVRGGLALDLFEEISAAGRRELGSLVINATFDLVDDDAAVVVADARETAADLVALAALAERTPLGPIGGPA